MQQDQFVIDEKDHISNHARDTLNNGHSICNVKSVKQIIAQGKKSIDLLLKHGVDFNRSGDNLDLTLEGGHSHRRIVFHNDNTGEEIHRSLIEEARSIKNIKIKENFMAIDLIGKKDNFCEGLYAFDGVKKAVVTIKSDVVILATGGASKVYQYTTNPHTSTGDGIAIAWRFGCAITNMEFIQFHPTGMVWPPSVRGILVTEGVRGEGGILQNSEGKRFMFEDIPDNQKSSCRSDMGQYI